MTHEYLYRNHREAGHWTQVLKGLAFISAAFFVLAWAGCQILNWIGGK